MPRPRVLATPVHQVGPFLKWAGGKGQLIEQFRRFLPETLEGRNYMEPFMGSAALFFYVRQNLKPASCTLLDINPDLVNTFRQVRDNVEVLLELLKEHKAYHNRDNIDEEERKTYYYNVRGQELPNNSPEAAARFIYLNKTCFNGLHRLNASGKFNVPMGSYKLPAIFEADHLRRASALLQGVTIETCSFHQCEAYIKSNDFVYFDPPYEPLSPSSSFTSYSKENFVRSDQVALRDLLIRLSPRCTWMISNSTAPFIEALYNQPNFHKHYVQASRSINSVGVGRGKVAELVVTNYAIALETAKQPTFASMLEVGK